MLSSSEPSKDGWIVPKNGWVKAKVEVSPNMPFGMVVSVVADCLGLPLVATRAFDEFPAVIGHINDHEVVVFDLPNVDEAWPDWVPKYRISIFPDYPENHPLEGRYPRDVSTLLIKSLGQLLPDCILTAG